ncbi:MAG TPA: glycoside hydrolase family 2 TIM barrel-domain containing protein, partial [Tepidisphaeraceae bacterium]
FCTAGKKSGQWTTIPVPSNWELHGFGTLSYYGDPKDRPAEEGIYRHRFAVPEAWQGQTVYLVFEGVMTDTRAEINGKPAGPAHQGGFYRFKYDVTPLLRVGAGDNELKVTVAKHSANESINRAERQADYWLFGGIFRPVYLEAVPAEHVDRVAINARADGSFAVDVFTPAAATATPADALTVDVLDKAGNVVATASGKPAAGGSTRLSTRVDGALAWTAETPNLYTARVRLAAGGRAVHEVTQRFGFRTVEVRRGDGVYVNGTRVVLKGVNRHAFWPDSGRTLSPRIDRADIELIQAMNMNAVRMSHYPPDQSFLDLCDEMGLYVIDELAGWQKSYDTPTARRLVGETVTRDVNHPSIIFWANGNEGGWNKDVDGDYAKWDPQARNVIHPWALHDNMQTKHYPGHAALLKLLAGPDVVLPTEFLHGMYDGGAGAGLRDFWDAMRASKVSAGGFFWVMFDEGVARPSERASGATGPATRPAGTEPAVVIDVAGNAAPDGIVGPYREKEGSFDTIRKIWSPVVIADKLPDDFDGTFAVENTYDFTSLDRVKFRWQLRRWRTADDERPGHTTVAEGDAPSPAIAPHTKGTLSLGLPADWRSADALALTATAPNGREIWTWVWPLKSANAFAPTLALQDVTEDGARLVSGDVTMRIEPGSGKVLSVDVGQRSVPFTGGPRLALGTPRAKDAVAPTGQLLSAKWDAASNGWFRLEYAYEAKGTYDFAGVTFDLPAQSVKSARWLGSGPHRVWKNRLEGPTLGVWETAYNDTVTGWSGWAYPEFKGYFADLHWTRLATDSGAITISAETPGLYLHRFTPSLPPERLHRDAWAATPDGGLSLMHAIPGIGSKFGTASHHGPQGEPTTASGEHRAVVWFRFQ